MKQKLQRWFETLWYHNPTPCFGLVALSRVFQKITQIRRFLYQHGTFTSVKMPVPVIIVGNLTVGGTGKSPLVAYLADFLSQAGYKPGIISRGYGSKAQHWPQRVFADSDPAQVGDEAVMLANKTGCPVAVGSVRAKAVALLLAETDCNLIISDDGLQHYALQRDIEIIVVDGERRFGNGYCLPAGPLREPIARVCGVDFVVVNGAPLDSSEFKMQVKADDAVNLKTGERRPLQHFCKMAVHAVAGIGNPQRFFDSLDGVGIAHTRNIFPDHYPYQPSDLQFDDGLPVLMTEKDAVKCRLFALQHYWYVPVNVELPALLTQQLLNLLQEKNYGSKAT